METWKKIRGWPYSVSDHGRVRSDRFNRILKQATNSGGYKYVALSTNCQPRNFSVHGLVLRAFVGPCPPGKECRHLDGDPAHNHLTNLMWGTGKENWADARRHGVGPRNVKLSIDQVRSIRKLLLAGATQRAVATKYGVSRGAIQNIATGRNWRNDDGV